MFALLSRNIFPKGIVNFERILKCAAARECHWLADYKPGPYPRTKEEKEKAAKKYNLLPEEYEPYEDDGAGCGDYPKLPFESVDAKDPWYTWDDDDLRRDYMEPVSREIMMLLPTGLSTNKKMPHSYTVQFFIFVSIMVSFVVTGRYLEKIKIVEPVLEKDLPYSGKIHYTFELDFELGEKLKRKSKCDCPPE